MYPRKAHSRHKGHRHIESRVGTKDNMGME